MDKICLFQAVAPRLGEGRSQKIRFGCFALKQIHIHHASRSQKNTLFYLSCGKKAQNSTIIPGYKKPCSRGGIHRQYNTPTLISVFFLLFFFFNLLLSSFLAYRLGKKGYKTSFEPTADPSPTIAIPGLRRHPRAESAVRQHGAAHPAAEGSLHVRVPKRGVRGPSITVIVTIVIL